MLDSVLCVLVRAIGWGLCRLPPSWAVAIGRALGGAARRLQPKRVQVGEANLRAAFGAELSPDEIRRMVREIFRNLGAGIVEMLRLPAIDEAYVDRYVEIIGFEHFEAARASGRPIMWLTGHFGNWELLSIVAAVKGYPIVALARAQDKLPKLYRLLVSYRESKGCRIVHKGGAMRQLVLALGRKELVGIVGDQVSRQGELVDFFGRPALFATGPFELARSSGALILPSFVHRRRGPYHQLVVDSPIDLSTVSGTKEEIARHGIAQFAAALTRHIRQDPTQWLWLHKRWKHSPARRVVIVSDGKLGHVKQSQTVVRALKDRSPQVSDRLVEIQYRHALGRAAAVAWSWLGFQRVGVIGCLRFALDPACFREVATLYADVVISCGASTAPINLLLSRLNRAKSIVVMNPAPLPLGAFSLAFVPAHDRVRPRPNVVSTYGALGVVSDDAMRDARQQLRSHPRFRLPAAAGTNGSASHPPIVAVFLGGDTSDYELTTAFVEGLITRVLSVCEARNGWCLVTTSRRTPPAVEQWLEQRLGQHPRCGGLLLASRDPLGGTVDGMLGWADVAVVTAESVSMVSEACASGRPVVVVEPPLRRGSVSTKSQRFVGSLAERGYVRRQSVAEVGEAIERCITNPQVGHRLQTYQLVQDAVSRVIP